MIAAANAQPNAHLHPDSPVHELELPRWTSSKRACPLPFHCSSTVFSLPFTMCQASAAKRIAAAAGGWLGKKRCLCTAFLRPFTVFSLPFLHRPMHFHCRAAAAEAAALAAEVPWEEMLAERKFKIGFVGSALLIFGEAEAESAAAAAAQVAEASGRQSTFTESLAELDSVMAVVAPAWAADGGGAVAEPEAGQAGQQPAMGPGSILKVRTAAPDVRPTAFPRPFFDLPLPFLDLPLLFLDLSLLFLDLSLPYHDPDVRPTTTTYHHPPPTTKRRSATTTQRHVAECRIHCDFDHS